MADVRPNAHKSLTVLRNEWSACVKCDLGERRIDVGGSFVFGAGVINALMFVGEGPGAEEERLGEPFVGRSGELLRGILQRLLFTDFYITNLVACRSCVAQVDGSGHPMTRTNFRTKQVEQLFKDEPPTPIQYGACMPRLYEEIYLVDPIVIVGLGNKACEALMRKSVTITRIRGDTQQIAIPGASHQPSLTDGMKWGRKVKGEYIMPTEQTDVLYHFVPTLHPSYVLRNLADKGPDSPFRKLVADLRCAINTYNTYLKAVFGDSAMAAAPTLPESDTVCDELQDEQENE